MDKKTYRLLLGFLLVLAITAGILYYQNVIQKQNHSHPGTLVYNATQELKA